MNQYFKYSDRRGLPGGPNEESSYGEEFIVSERGQWDYPGMNTLVPTDGNITMQGVPYPVMAQPLYPDWAQPAVGPSTMMYPDQDYYFPGAVAVAETPMARYGGGLRKYQTGKEVSYSSVVDPKTKKINLDALNRLQSLLKEQEIISQSRPEGAKALPEIQITAERPGLGSRIKNAVRPYVAPEGGFLDQWRQRIVDETGGADWYKQPNSVLGAFSSVVTSPLQAPQYGAVYAATDKVQLPSEALNIQNPYGAFATNVILDPVNLITGSSALRLPQRFSKVGRQAGRYASETIPNFSSMLAEDVSSRISGNTVKSIDPPYTYYRATSPESFANISNPINTSGVGTAMPENLTFFTPDIGAAKGTFSEYSPNRIIGGANLLFKNPYKVRQGEVWTNSRIKKLMDEGYDSIQVNYDASGDPKKAYEIIPLDKNIIQNAKPVSISDKLTAPAAKNYFDEFDKLSSEDVNKYYQSISPSYYSPEVQRAIDTWQDYPIITPGLEQSYTVPLPSSMYATRRLQNAPVFDEQGYLVSSKGQDYPFAFSAGSGIPIFGHQSLIVKLPEGTKVAPISKSASDISRQAERELLLPPNSKFKKVSSRKTDKGEDFYLEYIPEFMIGGMSNSNLDDFFNTTLPQTSIDFTTIPDDVLAIMIANNR